MIQYVYSKVKFALKDQVISQGEKWQSKALGNISQWSAMKIFNEPALSKETTFLDYTMKEKVPISVVNMTAYSVL